ncbi:hypothetical protein I7I50_11104 [Histoplasma capsulatum G186AR]|uniref:Uncharacterized protein n=1 Tax=Ajellomyces capsulatus TaxID=5037 RepID=A0A8H8D7R3_AJECA|nr:hypothetical protein I7I52_02343 [Histoplasma capsulatum]QSS69712.1 hypothetical protein I7I50_11104 [Histoplasma capsulatum G186AR]
MTLSLTPTNPFLQLILFRTVCSRTWNGANPKGRKSQLEPTRMNPLQRVKTDVPCQGTFLKNPSSRRKRRKRRRKLPRMLP